MKKYHSLTPKCDEEVDKDKIYCQALADALSDDGVKNIAVTGPYGSGKSSVLCWCKKAVKGEYSFLDISLATFKEEEKEKPTPIEFIEKNILEQLLYSVKPSELPQSKYKRITPLPCWEVPLKLLVFSLWAICLVLIFFPEINISTQITKANFYIYVKQLMPFVSLVSIFLLMSVFILYWILKFALRIQEIKLNFKNIEAKIGEHGNNSVLNDHLDEILYLFEKTQKNVVVIEDLDRFKNTEIFTRLRELNSLINKSPKIKEKKTKVTFIYAVKDDIFQNSERAKFFDFILPIIPHINPSNSYEKMQRHLGKYKFSEEYIHQISLFINDTRLLLNIVNEFDLYYEKHQADKYGLNVQNLFALIVYKNFFPQDFADLHKNEGTLYKLFHKKKKRIVEDLVKNSREQIEETKGKIQFSDAHPIEDIEELNKLLWLEIVAEIRNSSTSLAQYPNLKLDGEVSLNINMTPSNDDLEKISQGESVSYNNRPHFHSKENLNLENIRNRFNYENRKNAVLQKESKERSTLINKIKQHEKIIQDYKKISLQSLIQTQKINDILDESDQDLLRFFIRYGYIAEDYPKYISLFIESTITREDKNYALAVVNFRSPDIGYQIDNFEEVIKYFEVDNFGSASVLNFSILHGLIEHKDESKKYENYFANLLKQLVSGSEETIDFLKQYIDVFGDGVHISESEKTINFLGYLIPKYPDFWVDLTESTPLAEKEAVFLAILGSTGVKHLKDLNHDGSLLEYVENSKKFLSIIQRFDDSHLLENIITELSPKFVNLDTSGEDFIENFKYVCESQAYALNYDMVLRILSINPPQPWFEEKELNLTPYSVVQNSNLEYLVTRVDENLDDYINEMLAATSEGWEESDEQTSHLLRHEEIAEDTKKQFLERNTGKVNLLEIDESLWDTAISHSRIFANWESLIKYYIYKEEEVTDELIGFINSHAFEQGLNERIPKEVSGDKSTVQDFEVSILRHNNIIDEVHLRVSGHTAYYYPVSVFDDISVEKIERMCSTSIFQFNLDNYNELHKTSSKAALLFINRYTDEFLESIDDINLSSADYQSIVNTNILSKEKKRSIIEAKRIALDEDSSKNKDLVAKIISLYSKMEIPKSLVYLVALQIPYASTQEIDVMLNALGLPFSKMTITNLKKVEVPVSNDNRSLMTALKKKKYINDFKENEIVFETKNLGKPRK